MKRALLLSIRPKFADRIIKGIKTVELRRIRPSIKEGDRILIYISSPAKEVRAFFVVERIICAKPENLWNDVKDKAGITRNEFDDYFNGAKAAIAIHIKDVQELPLPINLSTLRKLWPNFIPPQSYRYVSESDFYEILQLNY